MQLFKKNAAYLNPLRPRGEGPNAIRLLGDCFIKIYMVDFAACSSHYEIHYVFMVN